MLVSPFRALNRLPRARARAERDWVRTFEIRAYNPELFETAIKRDFFPACFFLLGDPSTDQKLIFPKLNLLTFIYSLLIEPPGGASIFLLALRETLRKFGTFLGRQNSRFYGNFSWRFDRVTSFARRLRCSKVFKRVRLVENAHTYCYVLSISIQREFNAPRGPDKLSFNRDRELLSRSTKINIRSPIFVNRTLPGSRA